MAIAPDGSWLAAGDRAGSVRIWDPASGEQRAVLTGPRVGNAVIALAIAPDGGWLASGGVDGSVRIWDPASGEQRAVLTGHTGGVTAVAIAPDGGWLASGGVDGSVRIWDPATGGISTLMRVDGPAPRLRLEPIRSVTRRRRRRRLVSLHLQVLGTPARRRGADRLLPS